MSATLTLDQLLAAVARAIPDSYLEPLRDVGPGYELYQASAAVGVRCSQAVSRFENDVYILSARGGVLATVPVTFYRDNAAAGAGKMLAGTLLRASAGGQAFTLRDTVTFGPSDLTASGTAVANGYGYEWNIKGPFVDARGGSAPGELDTIDLPLQDPVFWDPSIRVRNDADSDGLGRPPMLDVLGSERNLRRQPGEDDVSYRVRIRTLPDTVTPNAIVRQLRNYFRRFPGLFWRHVETWKHEYQECFDAPDEGPGVGEPYDSTLFVFDDPDPPSPIRNRWLGNNDYLAAFIVEVGNPEPITDFSFVFDDPAADEVGVPSTIGVRALSAFDVPDSVSPIAIAPCFDGRDFGIEDLLINLYALLDEIKPGGAFVVIHLQET